MATRTKHSPTFEVRLIGPGVQPWSVPTRQLAKLLSAVQRLVEPVDSEDGDDEADEREAIGNLDATGLRLLSVRPGSAAYRLSSPRPTQDVQSLRLAGQAIREPAEGAWTAGTLSALERCSEAAHALGCQVELRLPSAARGRVLGDVLAIIGPGTYKSVEGVVQLTGDTSSFATIERVGGATSHRCGLRFANQPSRMVFGTIRDGEGLAVELAKHLFQSVLVSGRATWIRRSNHIRRFEIQSFQAPRQIPIGSIFERLRAAGGVAWNVVPDPDAYVAELRG
jgi:hypothetical protein